MITEKACELFLSNGGHIKRAQLDSISRILDERMHFQTLEVIETGASYNSLDGCFGLFFCKLALDHEGKFSTVDINPEIVEKSKSLYSQLFPGFPIYFSVSDSVDFLKNYDGTPNLVHLDSWDLDVKNPVPSMLHGWLEFDAIREKMPSGSICIIDDNFMKGSTVYWNWFDSVGNYLSTEEIGIEYEIVGKGSMIYHWAQKHDNDWDIIGDHYLPENGNIKLVIQKR